MSDVQPEVVLKPHSGPRDLADVLVGLAVAVPTLGVLYGVPAAMVWSLGGSLTLSVAAAALVGVLFTVVVSPLFTVSSLRVTPEGLRFTRRLGRPKFLRWEQITRIRPATRQEVVLWGWLLPPFPAREATRSTSSLGQVRIEWDRRYRFFPPADPRLFEEAVGRYFKIDEELPGGGRDEPQAVELPEVAETGNPYQPPQTMT